MTPKSCRVFLLYCRGPKPCYSKHIVGLCKPMLQYTHAYRCHEGNGPSVEYIEVNMRNGLPVHETKPILQSQNSESINKTKHVPIQEQEENTN